MEDLMVHRKKMVEVVAPEVEEVGVLVLEVVVQQTKVMPEVFVQIQQQVHIHQQVVVELQQLVFLILQLYQELVELESN